VVRELPAPGMQHPETTREVRTAATCVLGEPCEGESRGLAHGLVRDALMRAHAGSAGLRDGEGEEEVRPGERLLQVAGEPLLGCMRLTLRAMTMAPGMLDTVLSLTAWALREAVPVMAAVAMWDGAAGPAGRGGEVGVARKGCWRKDVKDLAEGGHDRSPCLRALRRS
jgi:hypothetical protein